MSDFAAEQLVPFLRNASLFSPLDDDSCRRLAESMELRRVSIGETIFHEGDDGHDAWLVFSGRIRLLKRSETGHQVTLGTQSVGEIFGALAILRDAPRTATVRAAEDCVLFRIERSEFEAVLSAAPEVRRYFEEFMQERAVRDFLRTATVLETLKSKDVTGLLDRLQPREFTPGDTIIREGEEGEALFIIRSGAVEVVQDADGQQQVLRTLSEGDCFGEWALIEGRTRTATVRAVEPTRCFALNRGDFDRLFQSSPRLRERLARRLAMYRATDSLHVTDDCDPPTESAVATDHGESRSEQMEFERLTDDTAAAFARSVDSQGSPDRSVLTPRRGLFGRWKWVPQQDESECGAASLAMVAASYGVNLPRHRFRDLAGVRREGTSLFSLATAAAKIGFQPRGIETDLGQLATVPLPAIAHWQGSHYVVVFEVGEETVTVGDPALGVRRLSHARFADGWTGRVLALEPTADLKTHTSSPSLWKRLRSAVPERTMTLFNAASVVLAMLLITTMIRWIGTAAGRLSVWHGTMLIGFCFIGAALREWAWLLGAERLATATRKRVISALQRVPQRFFDTRFATDSQNWLTDADTVAGLQSRLLRMPTDGIAICASVGLLLSFHAFSGGIVAIGTILHVLVLAAAWNVISRPVWQLQSLQVRSSAHVSELVRRQRKDLRTRQADGTISGKVDHCATKASRLNTLVHGTLPRLLQVVLTASSLLVAYLAWETHWQHIEDSRAAPLFFAMLATACVPLICLAGHIPDLVAGLPALARLEGLLAADSGTPDSAKGPQITRGEIVLDNVSFQIDLAEPNVLTGISLTIPAGQTVAVVGRDGSGRTALANLIAGHDVPTEGSIKIDGHDVSRFQTELLTRHLGVATRDADVFTGSVLENISCVSSTDSTDAAAEAARLAGAEGFISRLPQSWNTQVGTLGIELNGSQRQRLAIARALCDHPPILLFDRATSELDDEQENRLWLDLHAVLAESTVILIPHRLKAARLADHIIVLDGGVIAEQGTHETLLESGGVYSFLWSQAQA